MPSLIEAIEADAAKRLLPPQGRTVAQELPGLKTFLRLETQRLKFAHRNGASGLEVCRARARLVDLILKHLWETVRQGMSAQARQEFPPLALVAVGGYGRQELNPHSDVDIVLLHEGLVVAHQTRALPPLEKMLDGAVTPLWDLGLKPSQAVRSIAECVAAANDPQDPRSMETKTSFLEARLVIGDETLFQRFQKTVLARCVTGQEQAYIQARLTDQAARRAKHGNSATMQEPNIKNGCGGLRDFQNLLWMAWFKYRIRTLKELEERELLTRDDAAALEAAYDFLLRVRNELHYHASRAHDTLPKSLQPPVATALGFTDRSPSRRLEKFMRVLYGHMRALYLITRTLEERLALLPGPENRPLLTRWLGGGRRAPAKPAGEPVDGFHFVDGLIVPVSSRVFRDQPRRLMRAFLHAQQRGLRLHPDLAALIRNQLDLVDAQFLRDEHARETFLTILNHRGNVGGVLRQMHEVDFLGRYVPEFGRLTCLVQHEFFHIYTADEHTLQCLEQVDRVWDGKDERAAAYTPLLQGLERPFLLYLALLLHDVGKAAGAEDHSTVGSQLAMRVARRLELDEATAETLRQVIQHHLLPARTSQLRDLDDPAVLREFARRVQTVETLSLLTLHSFADAMATSEKLWTGFKDALLWTLHRKTLGLLTGGTEFLRAEERRRASLRTDTEALVAAPVDAEQVDAHFRLLPPRYFQIHSAEEIHEDLGLAAEFMELQLDPDAAPLTPRVRWRVLRDRACDLVKVCTWDREGLFSRIAGALSAAGLNILSAQIFTREDGIALDTFYVTDARTGGLADKEQKEQFLKLLTDLLAGKPVDLRAQLARRRSLRPLYQAHPGQQMPVRLEFDNASSAQYTLIEIEVEDRVGLLHAISQALTDAGLTILLARICTEKGAALDSFYVTERTGGKLLDPARRRAVEQRLREVIHSLERQQ